jgi:hypothetical protein
MVTGTIVDKVDMGRFIVVRYDDFGVVSYRVAALKKHPPTTPLVVILGGSAARECATTDGAMRSAIVRRWGGRVKVVSLASSVQRLASALAIIDNLPDQIGGVVVIAVHELTFAGTAADARGQLTGVTIMATSRALHDFIGNRFGYNPPNNMFEGLRRHLAWYLRVRGVPAFKARRGVAYQRHRYDVRGALPMAAKQAEVLQFRSTVGASPNGPFFTYFGLNKALLTRCVSLAKAKGYQVLLMEDPQDRNAIGHAYDVYKQRYLPVCRQLVARRGAHYLDINAAASLRDTDFYDVSHLLSSGRGKWTPRLIAAIVNILRDHPPVYLGTVAASASDPAPPPGGGETIGCTVRDTAGKPLKGASVTFVWHFESGPVESTAATGAKGSASSTIDISGATPGFEVVVDVTATWKGTSATATARFTPTGVTPTTNSQPEASESP